MKILIYLAGLVFYPVVWFIHTILVPGVDLAEKWLGVDDEEE